MHRGIHNTHRGTRSTHTDTLTGSSQKQDQKRRAAGGEELSGEAWAELTYAEKEGRAFREWGQRDSRRKGMGRGARSPKSRENPSCVCHALEFTTSFPISFYI